MNMGTTSRTHTFTHTSESRDHKWIYLLLFLAFCSNIAPALSSCPRPRRVKFGNAVVQEEPYDGLFSNGSKALVSCNPGYRLRSGDSIICIDGKWVNPGRNTPSCEKSYVVETKCEPPPGISNGYYHLPQEEYHSGSEETDSYPVGAELQATCEPSFSLNCSHQRCGKITCESDGTWAPKDGQQLITSCAAVPLTVVSGNTRDTRSDDHHGIRSHTTQNYLVIALAIVCIVGVGSLTVALIRRPLFCKKREDSQCDPHVMVTSSSPHHAHGGGNMDNSIPVAMNTGIFIPGADYDLQDYHLQDIPFVGTTVFK